MVMPRTKRQTRKAAMEQQQQARRAQRDNIEKQSVADKEKHKAKCEAEQIKREAERRRREERQREREQDRKQDNPGGDSSRRCHWEKAPGPGEQKKSRKQCHRDGSARSHAANKMTVSAGMQRHDATWTVWQSTLPRPDAHTTCPFPHPTLFSRYLASKSRAEDCIAAACYRDLMRRWHPDKFHQAIGHHLTRQQQDQLYPIAEALCKQINHVFGK